MVSLSKKRLDNVGRALSGACVTLIVLLVATLVFMFAQHGWATFFVDGISPTAIALREAHASRKLGGKIRRNGRFK